MAGTLLTSSWRAIAQTGAPLIKSWLSYRARRGKEDASRLGERFGQTNVPRPEGPLIWIHAASVGESLSVLSLIDRLLSDLPAAHVLITTGTVTSANLMAKRLPSRAVHQFAPFDRPSWVRAFLDHWQPDLGVWVESELWPTTISETAARRIPLALINARMSKRSHRGWTRWGSTARKLLGKFDVILAQDEKTAERLRDLGAHGVSAPGNIKLAALPLGCDTTELDSLKSIIGERPVWIAASINRKEEADVIAAHALLQTSCPGVLTIAAPRQPDRGDDLAEAARAAGLHVAQRSQGEALTAATEFYVADTIGEMGLFFRLGSIAFMGRSLNPAGGSNPLEAPPLGAAVLAGPHTDNFSAIYDRLDTLDGVLRVNDAESLAGAAEALLKDEGARMARVSAALTMIAEAQEVLDQTASALEALLARSPDAAA